MVDPARLKFRPGTWDRAVYSAVVEQNEYNLPPSMAGMTVVDIGGHTGSFVVACLNRDVDQITTVEADPENFAVLEENVSQFPNVLAVHAAVVPDEQTPVSIRRLEDHDHGMGRNTGHVDCFGPDNDPDFPRWPIRDLLREYERIDILKIDCEGMEWALFDAARFENVQHIVGELHADPKGDRQFAHLLQTARLRLNDCGFTVRIQRTSRDTAQFAAIRKNESAEVRSTGHRMLWVGDAVIQSGYGRVTREICTGLKDLGWDVSVLGLGYNGDPHTLPFPVYPVGSPYEPGHPYGLSRARDLIESLRPDIVVVQNDSWNVGEFIMNLTAQNIWLPIVGYTAVDGENVRADIGLQLNNLSAVACHTEFGVRQLRKAGYTGRAEVIPHGVDTQMYRPMSKLEARAGVTGVTEDSFIFGVVGANQPRKRLDLAMVAFSRLITQSGGEDTFLHIHAREQGAWSLRQLRDHLNLRGRVILTDGGSLAEAAMPTMYNSFDVQISTSEGESFGLPVLEGMACGIPQIVPHFGGTPSWAGTVPMCVNAPNVTYAQNMTNMCRRTVDIQDMVNTMIYLLSTADARDARRDEGLKLARQMPWSAPVAQFDSLLTSILDRDRVVTGDIMGAF